MTKTLKFPTKPTVRALIATVRAQWNANLDLKAALKRSRIENRNLRRLLGAKVGK